MSPLGSLSLSLLTGALNSKPVANPLEACKPDSECQQCSTGSAQGSKNQSEEYFYLSIYFFGESSLGERSRSLSWVYLLPPPSAAYTSYLSFFLSPYLIPYCFGVCFQWSPEVSCPCFFRPAPGSHPPPSPCSGTSVRCYLSILWLLKLNGQTYAQNAANLFGWQLP